MIPRDCFRTLCWLFCVVIVLASNAWAGTAGVTTAGTNIYPNGGIRRGDLIKMRGLEQLGCLLVDPTTGYAYGGTIEKPSRILKIALGDGSTTPTIVASLKLEPGEERLMSGVIDPASGYAWFGTAPFGFDKSPGRVIKVNLGSGANPPTRVGAVTLNEGEYSLKGCDIDTTRGVAVFGTYTEPARVITVSLGDGSNPPTRIGAITLNSGEDRLWCGAVDPVRGYAYFGTDTVPGRVIKIRYDAINPPVHTDTYTTVNTGENNLDTAVIDPANGYVYFATGCNYVSTIIKFALDGGDQPIRRISSTVLQTNESSVYCGAIDTANGYAYFGTNNIRYWFNPRVIKVALGTGPAAPARIGMIELPRDESCLYMAGIDPGAGKVYFANSAQPTSIVKVGMGIGDLLPTRLSALRLSSEGQFFSGAIDAEHGYGYFGTSSNPGGLLKIKLGTDSTSTTRIGSIVMQSGEENIQSVLLDTAAGYGYLGTYSYGEPPRVIKVALGTGDTTPTRIGSIPLNSDETDIFTGVIDPAAGYAYYGVQAPMNEVRIVKVALGSGSSLPRRIGSVSMDSGTGFFFSSVIDTAAGYAYFGSITIPAQVVKIALGEGDQPPTKIATITLETGESCLYGSVIDPAAGYAYFGTYVTNPGRIIKIALGTGSNPPYRIGTLSLQSEESALTSAIIDSANHTAYFGTQSYPGKVIKIDLGMGDALPTRIGSITLPEGEECLNAAIFNPVTNQSWFASMDFAGNITRITGRTFGTVNMTRFNMPETGVIESCALYSHQAAGNVRLALYREDSSTQRTLVWQSESVKNNVTGGFLRVPIGSGTPASLTLSPGSYHFAWQTDTLARSPSYTAGTAGEGSYLTQDYGAFPAALDQGGPTGWTSTNERWTGYVNYVYSSNQVWVDFGYSGTESGSEFAPYNTLGEGVVAVTPAGTVRFKPGQSSETGRIMKQMRMEAVGGTARIGN